MHLYFQYILSHKQVKEGVSSVNVSKLYSAQSPPGNLLQILHLNS